jgi:hypothetical protein
VGLEPKFIIGIIAKMRALLHGRFPGVRIGILKFSECLTNIVSVLEGLNDVFNDDKICMMTTRLACNQAIESSYWRMDNNSDVGLLTGYVLYQLLIELESMDLDTFSR